MDESIQLIEAAKAGDDESFGKLYETYRAKGINIARQYVETAEDAEDVYQDAFIKAMQHIDSFDTSRNFAPWLDTIIVNTAKNSRAKKKPQNFSSLSDEESEFSDTLENEDESIVPESAYDRKELIDIMDGIIGELPKEQREAVTLFYYKDMSVKQIAEYQGVSEDTVKSRLNYARKKVGNGVETYEKKTGIKLHSTAIPTVLFWLYFKNTIKAKAFEGYLAAGSTAAKAAAGTFAISKIAVPVAGVAVTAAVVTGVVVTLNKPQEVVPPEEPAYEVTVEEEPEVEEPVVEVEEVYDPWADYQGTLLLENYFDVLATMGSMTPMDDGTIMITWSSGEVWVFESDYLANKEQLDTLGEWTRKNVSGIRVDHDNTPCYFHSFSGETTVINSGANVTYIVDTGDIANLKRVTVSAAEFMNSGFGNYWGGDPSFYMTAQDGVITSMESYPSVIFE